MATCLKFSFQFCFMLISIVQVGRSAPLYNITVALTYDNTNVGSSLSTGMATLALAMDDLQEAQIIPEWIDFSYCGVTIATSVGAGPAVDLYETCAPDVMLGPPYESALSTINGAALNWNLLVVGFGTQTGATSTAAYKSFVGTSFTVDYSLAIINLILHFGWHKVGVLDTDFYYCNLLRQQLYVRVQQLMSTPKNNFTISPYISFVDSEFASLPLSAASVTKLEIMQQSARVFILCPGLYPYSGFNLIRRLQEQNMTTAEYVYILPFYYKGGLYSDFPWMSSPPADSDALLKPAFNSFLVVDTEPNATIAQTIYMNRVQRKLSQPPWNRISSQPVVPSQFERFLHDAFYLYGIGLNRTLSAPGASIDDVTNGVQVAAAMANVTFYGGATGTFRTGADRNRITVYTVLSFDRNGTYSKMASIELLAPDQYGWTPANISFSREAYFQTETGAPPRDVPKCGFMGELCYYQSNPLTTPQALAPIVLACFIIVGSAVAIGLFRRQQLLSQKRAMTWQIQPDELRPLHHGKRKAYDDTASEIGSINQSIGDMSRSFTKVASENPTSAAPFTGIGVCRGVQVSMKRIVRFRPNVVLSSKDAMILFTLKETRQENLNSFLGLILPDSEVGEAFHLWTYCRRGSLEGRVGDAKHIRRFLLPQVKPRDVKGVLLFSGLIYGHKYDILFNDNVELDIIFKSSMISDLTNGLGFIHKSTICCHGSLNASNCVVDSRWVLKLTDFGLQNILRKIQYSRGSMRAEDLAGQGSLHLAPEQLRSMLETGNYLPSKEGDMYSFGMVIYQICYREPLFSGMDISPADIVKQVAGFGASGPSLRPNVPRSRSDGFINDSLQDFIYMCWRETISERPDVNVALSRVLAVAKQQGSTNIIDHVILTMEQYTETLERLVEDRSKELQGEQERADNLLRQLLPQAIVDNLKQGKAVTPEFYDSVTICVSDIVQFTKLSSVSTPLEIVSMLNLLYSNFDFLCKQGDVYKVETIGDAYMVASGLPVRNGSRHAVEIAELTLRIKKFVETEFFIPHRPGERIQMRTGFHTGPVAAGIVGLTTPRFCIFGTTVNTASEMESTSEPLKIHLSERSAVLLKHQPRYVLDNRGSRETVSAGSMETYWLLEKVSDQSEQSALSHPHATVS